MAGPGRIIAVAGVHLLVLRRTVTKEISSRYVAMNRAIAIAGVLTLAAGLQAYTLTAAAQTVYKTVDEQGNVVFTDRPPQTVTEQPFETVEGLDIDRTDSVVVAAQRNNEMKEGRAQEFVRESREEDNAALAANDKLIKQERAANCQTARDRMKKYHDARRLYRTVDGERVYLSSAEIDSERESAAMATQEWCD